jgi:5-hydroxyisourate hydrolase-like protein (transthyretin family)
VDNFQPRKRRVVKAFAASLAVIALMATWMPAAARAVDDPNAATITGTVTSPSGQTVSGASICAKAVAYGGSGRCTNTDANGDYTVTVVPGSYWVSVNVDGYPQVYYATGGGGGVTNQSLAATLTVTSGSAEIGKDIQLIGDATITGAVTEGVSDATRGYVTTYVLTDGSWDQYFGTATDSTGKYTLHVPAGSYRLRMSPGGNHTYGAEYYNNTYDFDSATTVTVASGATVTLADVSLAKWSTISGTVTDPNGAALPGISVCPDAIANTEYQGCATSDASGAYTLGVVAGTYLVRTSADAYLDTYYADGGSVTESANATAISISENAALTGKDIKLAAAGIIKGTVYDGVTVDPNAWVEVYALTNGKWVHVDTTYTDADGTYGFNKLAPGSYRLKFDSYEYKTQYNGGAASLANATTITVTGGQTQTVDASLIHNATISGRVTDSSGVGVAEASVRADYVCATNDGDLCPGPGAQTDADGKYTIYVDPGTYKVSAEVAGRPRSYYASSGSVAKATDATAVAMAATNLSGCDIKFPATSATITGTVTDGTTPDAAATVTAYVQDGTEWTYYASVNTDPNGKYTLAVPDGAYKLRFATSDDDDAPDAAYSLEYYQDARTLAAATPVVVTTGETVVDASLAKKAIISGTITGPTGVPLAGNTVCYTLSSGTGGEECSSYADATGFYTVALEPGEYSRWLDSTYSDVSTYLTGRITVGSTDLNNVNIQLAPASATITGTVTDGSIADLDAYVSAYVPFGNDWCEVAWASTDSSGHYSLAVPAGSYKLRFSTDADGYRSEYYENAYSADSATAVVIAANQTKTIDASLAPLQTMTTAKPTISGTLKAGETLAASVAGWAPNDADFSYHWYADGAQISGARDSTYTLTSEEVGHNITVSVNAYDDGYFEADAESDPTAVVTGSPMTAPTPIVSGTAKVGEVLTAAAGTWSPADVSLAYQWYRGPDVIGGATSSTYTLVAADQGEAVSVKVTGSKSGYETTIAPSAATAAVAGLPMTAATPIVSGTAQVGATLTAAAGAWDPADVSLAYQWYRGDEAIAGATGSSYALVAADQGKAISVKVIGSKSGYETTSATSAATAAVAGLPMAAATPTISGTAKVGATLTAAAGAWDPADVSLAHQWYRGTDAINGATGSTYALVAADQGKAISVKVTGTKPGYESATSAFSTATAAVAVGTMTPATPTITGAVQVGGTLTATPGDWSPSEAAFTYKWYADADEIGTGSTIPLTSAQLGKKITVRVTGTKAGYASATATSGETEAVAPAPISGSTPSIGGALRVGQWLTANTGAWSDGVSLSYQWYRSGVPIPGATGASYQLTTADSGRTVTVAVTGTSDGVDPVTKASAATPAIGLATLRVATPSISGKAKVGKKLTAKAGTWGPSPVKLAYKWYANGKAIKGATKSSYKIAKSVKGKKITVKVTGSKAGYATVTKASKATKKVAK